MPDDDMQALTDIILEIQRVEKLLHSIREAICTLMRHYIADMNRDVAPGHVLPRVTHIFGELSQSKG